MHERAVEMFQTLQSRDTVEGSGMGLALVKKVVEHYSGKMRLESDGETGTVVEIVWPIAG
jgi:signal transduction histidine kinase